MYDFGSYIRISQELSSPCAPAVGDICSFKGFRQGERILLAPESFWLSRWQQRMREIHCFWLAALLHRECCAELRVIIVVFIVIIVFEERFFLKNGGRHRASVDEKKNRMRRHTIFRSYCHYYCRYCSRHAIVVTTIVTIVATENHITTHAIFPPSTDAQCRAPIFFFFKSCTYILLIGWC